MIALMNRVHTYAHPDIQAKLTEFYTNILECEQVTVPGTSMPAFVFSNNASLSVEFTEDALDDQQAYRSTWLEVKPDDPLALKQRVLAAGLHQVKHPMSNRFYFQAPGGQIWGIVEP